MNARLRISFCLCLFLVAVCFAQTSARRTATYRTLKKYGLVAEGMLLDRILCMTDKKETVESVTYRIQDDGTACVLVPSFLGTPKNISKVPTDDLEITNCLQEILSAYDGNSLMQAIIKVKRMDSKQFDFLLMYAYTDEVIGIPMKIKALQSVPKGYNLKQNAAEFVDSTPECNWYYEKM